MAGMSVLHAAPAASVGKRKMAAESNRVPSTIQTIAKTLTDKLLRAAVWEGDLALRKGRARRSHSTAID
jgi:hypothetical protein